MSSLTARYGLQMSTIIDRQPSVAKYICLAQDLRNHIMEGRLKPGDRLPSFVELRNKHQVSRGTVEKVHEVLERDGLIIREQGRGVFVAHPKGREVSGVIALAGGGFSETRISLFWSHLLCGIQEAAFERKMQLLLVNEHVESGVLDKVDGLLFSVNEEDIYETLGRIPMGLPCVSMLTPVDELSSVLPDDVQGAEDATRHLLKLGHRSIGHLVAGKKQLVENRLAGYRRAMNDYGIEPHLAWVRQLRPRANCPNSKDEFVDQGRKTIREWLRTNWNETQCSAIVVQNDPAAIGAIEELQASGIRVPEDVSVVGYDGIEAYDYFTPRLTTVEVPIKEVGYAAVGLLSRQIESTSSITETVTLPARLRIGESTCVANSG